MSLSFTIATIAEVLVGGFIIWGLFNEEKLADAEQKLFAKIKQRLNVSCRPAISVKADKRSHCA